MSFNMETLYLVIALKSYKHDTVFFPSDLHQLYVNSELPLFLFMENIFKLHI